MATENVQSKQNHDAPAHGVGDAVKVNNQQEKAQLDELDKVRSILFGEQARAHELRITRLEARLRESMDAVRAEMLERHKELEAFIQARSEEWTRALEDEVKAQGGQNEIFDEGLKTTNDFVREQAERQEQRLQETSASLREALDGESTAIVQDLNQKIDALSQALEKAVGRLNGEKLNRQHFARMLTQMVKQIEGA
jgi:hypothetical protein